MDEDEDEDEDEDDDDDDDDDDDEDEIIIVVIIIMTMVTTSNYKASINSCFLRLRPPLAPLAPSGTLKFRNFCGRDK